MEQSRPRNKENFIIVGNRSGLRFIIDFTLTLVFWLYSLLILFFFITAAFELDNNLTSYLNSSFNTTNHDIRRLILIGIILFIIFYALLLFNRLYNKKRFGSLNRRTYPSPVLMEELVALQLMDLDTIQKLQTQDYIVFPKNPIISLDKEKDVQDS